MKPPILVAKAVLLNEEGKILVLRRTETAPTRPLELDLPGGMLEEGEDYRQTVKREIKEETDVDIDPDELRPVYAETVFYEGQTFIRFLFVGNLPAAAKIKLSYEHDQQSFLSLDEVIERYNHPVWLNGIKFASKHGLLLGGASK